MEAERKKKHERETVPKRKFKIIRSERDTRNHTVANDHGNLHERKNITFVGGPGREFENEEKKQFASFCFVSLKNKTK